MLNDQIIKSAVSKYGAPLYLYDKRHIESRLREITSIQYENIAIFAATMANSNPELLKLYKKFGLGVFVNSIKHFLLCKSLGFAGKEIVWTSTGMTEREIRVAVGEGVVLNLDSLSQVELYGQINPGGRVGVRINIGDMPDNETYAGVFVGRKSRIGIFVEEIVELLSIVKKYNLTIIGLHVYLGTDIQNVSHFGTAVQLLMRLVTKFDKLEYIDLGGGFALPQVGGFNFANYNTEITRLMEQLSRNYGKNLKLILEPGRSLAGDAGYFVTRVTDVKFREDFKYIFVEGSSAIFPKLLFYPDLPNNPHYVLGKQGDLKIPNVNICGTTTYSRDFLAKDSGDIPKSITIGDIVVFQNAGSYAYYSKTDFLGAETPVQVLVDGDNITLISPRDEC